MGYFFPRTFLFSLNLSRFQVFQLCYRWGYIVFTWACFYSPCSEGLLALKANHEHLFARVTEFFLVLVTWNMSTDTNILYPRKTLMRVGTVGKKEGLYKPLIALTL